MQPAAETQPEWSAGAVAAAEAEAEADAAAAAAAAQPVGFAAAASAAGAEAATPLRTAAAATAAAAAAVPRSSRRGPQAEQEIFNIVFAREEESTAGPKMPPGLPSRYSPLVNAKDAPQVGCGGWADGRGVAAAALLRCAPPPRLPAGAASGAALGAASAGLAAALHLWTQHSFCPCSQLEQPR